MSALPLRNVLCIRQRVKGHRARVVWLVETAVNGMRVHGGSAQLVALR